MKNILITGATGMLGKHMVEVFLQKKELFNLFTTSQTPLNDFNHFQVDLTKEAEVEEMLNVCFPEIIIHCAAITNLKLCEESKEKAYNIHVKATENLIKFDSVRTFVYISTDSVFDGMKGGYTEMDITNPLNVYASTKLLGEKVVLKSDKNFYILRTNIIGSDDTKKTSLFDWAYSELIKNKKIKGFNDVFFNPLYTNDLAKICKEIVVKQPEKGIYNIASENLISKYEFLNTIAKELFDNVGLVESVSIDSFDSKTIRPKNTTLNIQKIKSTGINIPTIGRTIKHLLENVKNDLKND